MTCGNDDDRDSLIDACVSLYSSDYRQARHSASTDDVSDVISLAFDSERTAVPFAVLVRCQSHSDTRQSSVCDDASGSFRRHFVALCRSCCLSRGHLVSRSRTAAATVRAVESLHAKRKVWIVTLAAVTGH